MVRGKPVKHWENRFAFDYAFAGNSIRPFHRASRSKQKQISAFYLLFIFRSLCSHLETRLSAIPSFSALKWTKRWEKKTAHTFTQNTQQNFNCYSNRYPDGYLDVWDGFSNDPVNTINWRSWSDDIQKRASVWAFFFSFYSWNLVWKSSQLFLRYLISTCMLVGSISRFWSTESSTLFIAKWFDFCLWKCRLFHWISWLFWEQNPKNTK